MESRAKFMGHPIHPMLIVFPLGLLVTSVIFDIAYLITGNDFFPVISYYNILAGMIGGLVAAIFGFRDWVAIPGGTRAKSIGAWHGVGNVLVVALFFISWLLRQNESNFVPPTLALVMSFVGIAIGTVTGWLGGELVDRLGIGVDPGAHPDASSSLSREPASASAPSFGMQNVPVTGGEKYREKHIQKDLPVDSDLEPKTQDRGFHSDDVD